MSEQSSKGTINDELGTMFTKQVKDEHRKPQLQLVDTVSLDGTDRGPDTNKGNTDFNGFLLDADNKKE